VYETLAECMRERMTVLRRPPCYAIALVAGTAEAYIAGSSRGSATFRVRTARQLRKSGERLSLIHANLHHAYCRNSAQAHGDRSGTTQAHLVSDNQAA
jgi:hypothetical protein